MSTPGLTTAAMSPAAQALSLGAGGASGAETEEEKKKRLLALEASQRNIAGALGGNLSPAAMSLGLT